MLSQTSSSVSFWTEAEVNLHTVSACVCVYQWVKTSMTGPPEHYPTCQWHPLQYPVVSPFMFQALYSVTLHVCMHETCMFMFAYVYFTLQIWSCLMEMHFLLLCFQFQQDASVSKQIFCTWVCYATFESVCVCVMFHREWGLAGSLKGLRQTFMIHC